MSPAALVLVLALGSSTVGATGTEGRNTTLPLDPAIQNVKPSTTPSDGSYSHCDSSCQSDQQRLLFAILFGVASLFAFVMAACIFRHRRLCRLCGKRRAEFCSLANDRGPQRCAHCRHQTDRRLTWSWAECEWRSVRESITVVARRSVTVYGFPVDAIESGFLTATVGMSTTVGMQAQAGAADAQTVAEPLIDPEPQVHESGLPARTVMNPLYQQPESSALREECIADSNV